LEESKAALEATKDEYAALKDRTKLIAGELKERRMECRTLQSEVDVIKENNYGLQDTITQLQAQGMDLNQSSQETSNELNSLRGQLMDKELEWQTAQAGIAAATKKGETALAAYKKKAQQSLAVANARTASAAHAKEEAELEARAARSTADTSMERAVEAELKSTKVLAEAKIYVQEMEQQVATLDDVKAQWQTVSTQLEQVRLDASTAQEGQDQLTCELQSVAGQLEAEQKTTQDVRDALTQAETRSVELMDEVERLRRESQRWKEELRRANEAKHVDANNSSSSSSSSSNKKDTPGSITAPAQRTAEAEATIAMLQRELQDANLAIKELKETLKAAMEEQPAQSTSNGGDGGGGSNNNNNGGMPLFYAMEKQAELTQARNEIARLASLLGDSESGKQDAIHDMGQMGRQLEDVQAQLQRQERMNPEQEHINVEYLKNIILSFLNAKTILEKKTLLPVIGTVLCLTPDEQRQAMEQVDKSGKLSMDTVSNSLLNLKWS
jgi:chromosome segregation ATPase